MTASTRPRGSISLYSGTYLIGNTAKQISTVGAGFYIDSTLANATSCVSATFTPCSVSSHGAPLAAAPALATRDAGEIAIRGGTSPIVLTPTAEGAYRTASDGSSSLWSGGESLTITAGGGTVPAFATTIVAPPALVISSPTNATRGLAIDRNRPPNRDSSHEAEAHHQLSTNRR